MFNYKRFKAALILSGRTMKDVSNALKINEATLYRKCHGKSEFTRREIQEICKYLDLDSPVGVFFDEELTETQEGDRAI